MQVLMLTWEYPPHLVGGMGKHVAELVPALDAAGISVHVLTPWLRGGPERERLGERSWITRVPTPNMPDYGFISFSQETNRRLEAAAEALAVSHGPFDLVHGHDWLTAHASVALKYRWHVPLLTTIHATERGRGRGATVSEHAQTINGLEWWLAYESWRVIVCSQFMAGQIQQFFNTPIDKLSVVPNGVTVAERAWSADERAAFRADFAHPNEKIVFSVARMVHEKGMHILIEAVPRVLAERGDVKFVIAGIGHQLSQLQARVHELGVADRVFFTGFISDEDRDCLYAVADVAVFPSLYEPFGIVALEAMAARCPVVVSDTGGLSEVVQLHETGLTVYPDNPGSLAWGILHTLAHPDWAETRAENAMEQIRAIYNWPMIAHETKTIYEHVLAEWSASDWGKKEEQR